MKNQKKFPFPGIQTTTDGSTAVAWVETRACSGAGAYPITPSTNMGNIFEQAVSNGAKNVWGETLVFLEPESEHSAASVCEGYALAGGRVANFTSSQGLVLMKEVLFPMAGKRLPVVFHVASRVLAVHAINVHAGHNDIMSVADCGWGILFSKNAQEVADLSLIVRRVAEDSMTPFFSVQDGFLTSHTVERALLPEPELIKSYLKPPKEALRNLMDPKNPVMSGVLQNQDAYMRGSIAQRAFYAPIKENLRQAMEEFYKLTGRKYDLIELYRMQDAEWAIVGMGSYMETAKITADWLRDVKKQKVGVVSVLSYRPFPGTELVEALSKLKGVAVLERMDEPGAPESPLARGIKAAFVDAISSGEKIKVPVIQCGVGGLGGLDVRVRDFVAIVDNLKLGNRGKMNFCLGIPHKDSIKWDGDEPDLRPKGSFSMRGYSIGGFGSVTTNKVIASICSDLFDLDVQAYPKYGAEKKGLPTKFFLTIAPERILTRQELRQVELVAMNHLGSFQTGNPLYGLTPGGTLWMQTTHKDPKKIWDQIPASSQDYIRKNKVNVYGLDATRIAKEVARESHMIQRMQGIVLLGIFLRVTPFAKRMGVGEEELFKRVEVVVRKNFGSRDERVVEENMTCIKRGFSELIEVTGDIKGA
ncbi:MAG: pyruvate ferredoxin oxidoreductase [Deltaproteobacteria bacterium RIFCSPHIGHO2_12_FULL_43_9]|nr:MAG: pyruvate ferredoxin oxidoreductase [Deltaproteobacteria bacterium RIFCSPHIGHO2_12_FULL_43_9]